MTTRIPVSALQNKWSDAQRVDKSDMDTEQNYNNQTNSAIVQNFFGSGVLLDSPEPRIIFDSENLTAPQAALFAAGSLDGVGLDPHLQPSDSNYGNQLAVDLTGSSVFGRYSVKVAIIGLDFEGNLQCDKFVFHKDETQISKNHYTRVLTILFNDFMGNLNCSKLLDGKITIREAKPFELSKDCKSVSQDLMPDLFWRDFKVADCNKSLFQTLQEGIGSDYSIDALSINTTGKQPHRKIGPNDVTTIIGQKFKANTNNIQKITLLIGVDGYNSIIDENTFNWDGDLVVSLYKLQDSVNNPNQIVPELAIDFEPEYKPIVEVSFSQSELRSSGIVLTDIAQPVDFVFTNTVISSAGGIEIGKYYILTIKRSGATLSGTVWVESGNDITENSRLSIYGGSWVDVQDEDLWFQVWSDSVKFSDGQAYDNGNGIISTKTKIDEYTGAVINNSESNYSFINTGSGIINTAIVQASINESVTVQDERTGNNISSRKEYSPEFSLLNNSDLNTLSETSEPLILGHVTDVNPKITSKLINVQNYPGLAKGNSFIIINPDPDLLTYKLIGRKLIPQQECITYEYRIFKVISCTDGYGDVNGDGVIDQTDVERAAELAAMNADLSSTVTQQAIIDGYVSTLEILRADVDGDGVVSSYDVDLIQNFINKQINSFPVGTSFNHIELKVQPSVGRWDGYYECDDYVKLNNQPCFGDWVSKSSLTQQELIYYGNRIDSSIDGDNPSVWNANPFLPITFNIEYVPFWEPWLISLSAKAREIPVTFTYKESISKFNCDNELMFECQDRDGEIFVAETGRNDFYVPGNLVLGDGDVIRKDGSLIKSDIEVGIINIELPSEPFTEVTFNIFRHFVADSGNKLTAKSFPAMKYSDCSTVQIQDLSLNKVRFNVSIQSIVPNLDGYSGIDGYGIVVDDIIGVYMNHSTGILTLTAKDLTSNPIYKTMITKIQIAVYLKKSGWNNGVLTITPEQVSGLAS
jgi:hypothetical protein